ncbi:hypothetical protein FQN50_007024 [Emmonsiellopsis sp. PD_5]|nr:hypothetical protein FQN50_007024 [Emmonsiellopsis sp. PD_5]
MLRYPSDQEAPRYEDGQLSNARGPGATSSGGNVFNINQKKNGNWQIAEVINNFNYGTSQPDSQTSEIRAPTDSLLASQEEMLHRLDYAGRRARESQLGDQIIFDETLKWVWNSPLYDWLLVSEMPARKHAMGSLSPFWIRGKPASGKSTLINYLAKSDEMRKLLNQRCAKRCIIIKFFFDFRQTTNIRNNFKGLLLSLLYCLVKEIPVIGNRIKKSEWNDIALYHQWPTSELQSLVDESVKACPESICILIDGLDEYEGDMLDLAHFLLNLGFCKNVALCVASRPHEILDDVFEGIPTLEMQDFNFSGVKTFVSLTLQRAKITILPGIGDSQRGPKVNDSIEDTIATKAEGVFLWARFAMNQIPRLWLRGERDYLSLVRSLEELPTALEDIWTQTFDRLTPSDREEASILMQLVCFAERELDVQEVLEAMQQVFTRPNAFMGKTTVEKTSLFARRIRIISGGLLEVLDASDWDSKAKYPQPDLSILREGTSIAPWAATYLACLSCPEPILIGDIYYECSQCTDGQTKYFCFDCVEDGKKCHEHPYGLVSKVGGKPDNDSRDSNETGPLTSQDIQDYRKNRPARGKLFGSYKYSDVDKERVVHRILVKPIHKTVRTYLDRRGWTQLAGAQPGELNPEAMWLNVCASVIGKVTFAKQRALCASQDPRHNSRNAYCSSHDCVARTQGKVTPDFWSNAGRDSLKLLTYAICNFPFHARVLEQKREVSSYPVLKSILCPELLDLHGNSELLHGLGKSSPCPIAVCPSYFASLSIFPRNILHFAALHGLSLLLRDLLSQMARSNPDIRQPPVLTMATPISIPPPPGLNSYSTTPSSPNPSFCGQYLHPALLFANQHKRGMRGNYIGDGFDEKIVRTVLEGGPKIHDDELVAAIADASVGVVNVLFSTFPPSEPKTIKYVCRGNPNSDSLPYSHQVGPIWVVAREAVQDIEAKFDYFLERGDDIDARWGINQSAMHAIFKRETWVPEHRKPYQTKPPDAYLFEVKRLLIAKGCTIKLDEAFFTELANMRHNC